MSRLRKYSQAVHHNQVEASGDRQIGVHEDKRTLRVDGGRVEIAGTIGDSSRYGTFCGSYVAYTCSAALESLTWWHSSG